MWARVSWLSETAGRTWALWRIQGMSDTDSSDDDDLAESRLQELRARVAAKEQQAGFQSGVTANVKSQVLYVSEEEVKRRRQAARTARAWEKAQELKDRGVRRQVLEANDYADADDAPRKKANDAQLIDTWIRSHSTIEKAFELMSAGRPAVLRHRTAETDKARLLDAFKGLLAEVIYSRLRGIDAAVEESYATNARVFQLRSEIDELERREMKTIDRARMLKMVMFDAWVRGHAAARELRQVESEERALALCAEHAERDECDESAPSPCASPHAARRVRPARPRLEPGAGGGVEALRLARVAEGVHTELQRARGALRRGRGARKSAGKSEFLLF